MQIVIYIICTLRRGEIWLPLKIKIDNFEGPFDLLLHLIKKNEMDIYDIKIYEITNQYLQYLKQFKEMDLEITSEFIVIAATLIEIKSKLLLPKNKADETAVTEEIDPRKILIDKLVEYKKYKAVAEVLRKFEASTGTTYSKKPEIIEEKEKVIDNSELFKGITMLSLFNLYNELINRYNSKINTENRIQKEIPADLYKIEDKMLELKNNLDNIEKIYFTSIIKKCTSKIEVVVTFLAMLELIKQRSARAWQENNFQDIYLERINEDEELWYKSTRNRINII